MKSIGVPARSAESDGFNYVKELKEGQAAPFHGALVPYVTLYKFEEAVREIKFCQPTLAECEQSLIDSSKTYDHSGLALILGGFASGILITLIIYNR